MKTKILIVEDDPHILLGLEEVLKSDGFEVAVCNRGDQAVAAFAHFERWSIRTVPRAQNAHADALVNQTLDAHAL